MAMTEQLVDLLQLEQLDINLYRSLSYQENHRKHLFGGQVLGQALVAASQTVEDRKPHSLHGYFLRAGSSELPVIYDVDRIRDGRSFTTRRVVAKQKGRAIFNMAVSYHTEEAGYEHQMPFLESMDDPDTLPSGRDIAMQLHPELPEDVLATLSKRGMFELRPVDTESYLSDIPSQPVGRFWIKATGTLPDDPILHRSALAYASDLGLMATSLFPHPTNVFNPKLMPASLDHAMWFHTDFRADEWLLYATDSPWAGGARGLNRGQIYTRDGKLVASTVQEGLIRPLD